MTVTVTVKGRAAVLAAVLVAAVLAAYAPAFRAGFVWDDTEYVTANPLLRDADGLRKIWFSREAPSQYFPLVYTVLRGEYALWGVDPRGYHAVNILLHAVNALLLWRILAVLAVPGGWLAAMLFALHPVQVESVAWVTELKNVLSALFCFLTILAWTRFTDRATAKPWRPYALCLSLYALALAAKTTAATLPAALLLVDWYRGRDVGRRQIVQLAPFAALGCAMGALTVWWERVHQGTWGPEFAFTPIERLLIAGRALWFYLAKLAWPAHLAFNYPRWKIDAGEPAQYLWPLAALGAGLVLWRSRGRRGPAAAFAFFAVTLAPLLGFFSLYTFKYSFVADHYQYVAAAGPLALAAAVLQRWRDARPAFRVALHGVAGAVLLVLAALTWGKCHAYRDWETLWRDTIANNPESVLAHYNLGLLLAQTGRQEEAVASYREAARIEPENPVLLNNYGTALLVAGKLPEAEGVLAKVVRLDPGRAGAHANLGNVFVAQGRNAEALAQYREAIRLDPLDPHQPFNIGRLSAVLGDYAEAERWLRVSLQRKPGRAETHRLLATVLAKLGRTAEARDELAEAVRLRNQR
jgi:tetratricopeptide (TPR) repeat protein